MTNYSGHKVCKFMLSGNNNFYIIYFDKIFSHWHEKLDRCKIRKLYYLNNFYKLPYTLGREICEFIVK